MRPNSMKSHLPKKKSLSAPLQEMHLLYNFDELCLVMAADKKTD